jgi:Right handed beta helix region
MATLRDLLALSCVLAFCLTLPGQAAPTPAPNPAPQGATVDRTGWESVSFVDLAKRVKADCAVVAPKQLRCSGPVRIDDLTKTSVNGHGMRLEFSDSRPGKGGIIFVNATHVELADMEVGWLSGGARDPVVPGAQRIQSLGEVAACANHAAGGMLSMEVPLEGMQPLGAVTVWDNAKGWPWYKAAPDAVEVYLPGGTQVSFSRGLSDCVPQLASLVGRHVLVRHVIYADHAFQCWGCRNVTVEKVKVTSAPGMAFLFTNGGSNLTLRGDTVAPKCSPHCPHPEPSTSADASHFVGVAGPILIEGSDFGWQGDDSVNVTGTLIPAHAESETEASGRWLVVAEPWRSRLPPLTVGSKVLLFDPGLSSLGDCEVLAAEPTIGRIRVSQLPANTNDFIIAGAETLPKDVIVRNNRFHDNRARGILMGGSDALIENNVIARVTGEAILIPADTGPWYEGPGAQNVTIKDNRIADVNRYVDLRNYPSAISAGVSVSPGYAGAVGTPIRHIVVEGNSLLRVYTNADMPVSFGKGVEDGQSNQH